jgi:CBS domain-containing protein
MLGIQLTDPVGTLIGAPVATIRPTDTLQTAADAFVMDAVGLLVVVDAGGVRGVLSERDLVVAVSERIELDEARVRDHATCEVIQVDEDASVLEAAEVMARSEVRHLAVSRDDVVIGVVSIRDVVGVMLEEQRETAV